MPIYPTWTLVAMALPLLWLVLQAWEGEASWGDEARDEEPERDGLYDDDLWRGP